MYKHIFVALISVLTLMSCADSSSDNSAKQSQLLEAIRNKDLNSVQALVDSGRVNLDPPTRSNEVNKALAYASIYGNLEIVKYVLAQGVDIDGKIAYGGTALLRASEVRNNDIAEFLIRSGADVNIPNSFGISAMTGYAIICNTKLIDLAIEHGGNIDKAYAMTVSSNQGQLAYNPIQWAVSKGNLECVKHLVSKGAATNVISRENETLLDIAKKKDDPKMVSFIETEL